jgi:hypothetical protein
VQKLYEVKLLHTYVIAGSASEPNLAVRLARYYLRTDHDLATEVAERSTLMVAPINSYSQVPEHYKRAIPFGGPVNMPVEQYFPNYVKQLRISKLQEKIEELRQELKTLKDSDD